MGVLCFRWYNKVINKKETDMSAIDDINEIIDENWAHDDLGATPPTASQIMADVYDPETNTIKVVSL